MTTVLVPANSPRYLLNLFSSDVNGLTFETEGTDLDKVMQSYYGWTRIDLDFDADGKPTAECAAEIERERAAGMFSIEEQHGPRIVHYVNLMAIYKPIPGEKEGNPDYKPLLHQAFRTLAHAQTEQARAKKRFEEDNELDKGRYENDLRTSQIMSVKGISDAKPAPWRELDHYYGGIETKLAPDLTVEELKAIQWPEPGFKGSSEERAFTVTSGQLRVTDPCYNMDTWCAGNSDNVKNGRWLASIGRAIDESDLKYTRQHFEGQVAEIEAMTKKAAEALGEEPTSDRLITRIRALRKEVETLPEEERIATEEAIDALVELHMDIKRRDLDRYGDPMQMKGRVTFLHIRHEDTVAGTPELFSKSELDVGVDSGGAGFFDMDYFKKVAALKDHAEDKDKSHPHHEMYRAYGDAICGSESWGALEQACFSSSGYGDGGYSLFERRDEAGLLIEARIVYMHEGNDGFVEPEEDEDLEEGEV